MKWVEIGFIILSVINMFFWSPPYKTYFTNLFLRIPPINAYVRFFGLGANWPMFSNPSPNYKEIMAHITFVSGETHSGYCYQDPLLIEIVGIKTRVHKAKYYAALTNEQLPAAVLARRIFDGFENRGKSVKQIKIDMMLIGTHKYPEIMERKLKNLVVVDLVKGHPKFSIEAIPKKPLAKAG